MNTVLVLFISNEMSSYFSFLHYKINQWNVILINQSINKSIIFFIQYLYIFTCMHVILFSFVFVYLVHLRWRNTHAVYIYTQLVLFISYMRGDHHIFFFICMTYATSYLQTVKISWRSITNANRVFSNVLTQLSSRTRSFTADTIVWFLQKKASFFSHHLECSLFHAQLLKPFSGTRIMR